MLQFPSQEYFNEEHSLRDLGTDKIYLDKRCTIKKKKEKDTTFTLFGY